MILIADSGSTKTDWCLCHADGSVTCVVTQGVNPFHQDETRISAILAEELISQLPHTDVRQVFFYGSGCRDEQCTRMHDLLYRAFPHAAEIVVDSDLMGAARALCGHKAGMACILGTGANSCLYDGDAITQNTPPMGYILGDEGSGAVLGKLLVSAIVKGHLSETVKADFYVSTGLTPANIVHKVYREPMPNRFLASLSPFVHRHLADRDIRKLVAENFRSFFRLNLEHYRRKDLCVYAVGSIAYYYREVLEAVALEEGYRMGKIEKSPMERLVAFHREAGER